MDAEPMEPVLKYRKLCIYKCVWHSHEGYYLWVGRFGRGHIRIWPWPSFRDVGF